MHISTKRGNGVSTEEILMKTSPIRARGTSYGFDGLDAMGSFAETSRGATSRAWVNTKSLGLDRPHAWETRQRHSQESHEVEPTGEV